MKPMSHEVLRKMLARSKKSNTEGVMLTREEVAALLFEFGRFVIETKPPRPYNEHIGARSWKAA